MIKNREQAEAMFLVLGIKDITTNRQRKNGTLEWELPIQKMYSSATTYAIRYASYKSGYMRNTSPSNTSCWQINKKFLSKQKKWSSYSKEYYEYESNDRILVNSEDDRVVYIANYILRNNYKAGSLYSVDDYSKSHVAQAYYENHNNVMITHKKWNYFKDLEKNDDFSGNKEALRVCSDLLDEEILKGLDQRERIKLQVNSLYNLREEIGTLKIENAANKSCKCEDFYSQANIKRLHDQMLGAPDVSITINGVKYTEDEN